jgi:hypothetical protein
VSHDAFRHHDAAYVLGSLSPADRHAFEDHLRTCEECRRAVAEVAGLPGLLARVGPDVLEGPQDEPPDLPVPDTLLPRLRAEVRLSRWRRRAWSVAAAAAVTAVVATGVAVGVSDRTEPPAGAGQATALSMTPLYDGPLRATLAMEDVAWGTRLSITCSYENAYYGGEQPAYALVVTTRDGSEQVATWKAVPGREVTVDAATASRSSEITSVEVRTTRGEPVLRLTG